jgi:hypothetical protein
MKVAKAKGRLRGTQPKLKPKQAKQLLELHDSGSYTQAELAELFGVARSAVYRTIERMRPKPRELSGHSHISFILRDEPAALCYDSISTCYDRYMTALAGAEWQLVSITTGREASLRVYVWRQLRRLGALYLHRSVCLLPSRPEVHASLQPILLRVHAQGGTVRNLTVRIEGSDHDALVAEQRAERDEEYREVVGRVPAFLLEIAMETARGRATYPEVEESEADLDRFEKWLAAISARDYFQAPAGDVARAAVQQCRDAFTGFQAAALAAEFGDDDTGSSPANPLAPIVVEDAP